MGSSLLARSAQLWRAAAGLAKVTSAKAFGGREAVLQKKRRKKTFAKAADC
jgi:hypothetical protein